MVAWSAVSRGNPGWTLIVIVFIDAGNSWNIVLIMNQSNHFNRVL
jgi:hypothetical protein